MQIDFDHVFKSIPNQSSEFQQKKRPDSTFSYTQQQFIRNDPFNSIQKQSRGKSHFETDEDYSQSGGEEGGQWKNEINLFEEDRKNKIMSILQQAKFAEDEESCVQYEWFQQSIQENSSGSPKREKGGQKMKKTLKRQEINEMTNRLMKKTVCKKTQCKEMANTKMLARVKEQALPREVTYKQKSLEEICQFYKKNPKSQLHQRLFSEHLQKQFRGMELSKEAEEKYSSENNVENYENPEYLQNYVHFYKRLDKEVDLYFKKKEFYEKSNQIKKKYKNKEAFHPNIDASQKSLAMLSMQPKIKPKEQKNRLKGTFQMMNQINLSIGNQESMRKAQQKKKQQILNQKKENFIRKICQVFEYDGEFVVTPDGIEQLTESEFESIFPLISQIEENEQTISIHRFEGELRKFYDSLGVLEKRKIRDSAKEKKKECCTQRIQTLPAAFENYASRNPKTNTFKKENKKKGDYLRKIQNFV